MARLQMPDVKGKDVVGKLFIDGYWITHPAKVQELIQQIRQ